ncbi:MAG: phosphoenolpyruvate carboxykinase (ATP) [Candidatus Zixiibacteriota bacterium]
MAFPNLFGEVYSTGCPTACCGFNCLSTPPSFRESRAQGYYSDDWGVQEQIVTEGLFGLGGPPFSLVGRNPLEGFDNGLDIPPSLAQHLFVYDASKSSLREAKRRGTLLSRRWGKPRSQTCPRPSPDLIGGSGIPATPGISGYTSKVAGTEIELGKEPEVTFSACFGAPFMVHHPYYYAELLKNKILKHNANCWLVNTGWTGGSYGIGKRMSIHHTRTLLDAALTGKLLEVEYRTDPVFGFQVPKYCPDVPDKVLNPADTWGDPAAYQDKYLQLASLFIENFKKFKAGCPPSIIDSGPVKREFLTVGRK